MRVVSATREGDALPRDADEQVGLKTKRQRRLRVDDRVAGFRKVARQDIFPCNFSEPRSRTQGRNKPVSCESVRFRSGKTP